MGKSKYLIVLAIAAVGLFAMPGLLATYAGTHTITDNAPGTPGPSGKALDCRECHDYIFQAANLTGNNNAQDIWSKHNNSAADLDYTTYMAYYGTDMTTNITSIGGSLTQLSSENATVFAFGFDRFFTARSNQSSGNVKYGDILGRKNTTGNTNGSWYVVDITNSIDPAGVIRYTKGNVKDDISGKEWSGCLFCHRSAFFYGGTHTRLQVRGCTNQWCHGNGATPAGGAANARPAGVSYMGDIPSKSGLTTTLSGYSKSAETGKSLNKTADAHNKWFDASAAVDDSYQNPINGENYTKDYYTCMGCHTHADVDLKITKSTGFNATIDSTDVTTITLGYTISQNETNMTSSKWGAAFK